jgi:lipopolysaccharide transport system permease protein
MITLLNPYSYFRAFNEILLLLTKHRQLTAEMVKREISERYAGQFFGVLWAVGHPMILMAIYVFVFAFIFRAKVGGTYEMPLDYMTYMLSGLIPWMTFQESMMKAGTAIVSQSRLVKQVVFPVEILPVKGVFATFITQIVSLVVLIIYVFVKNGFIHMTYLLIPVLSILQIMGMIGVSYILSSVGVYFRDIKDFIQVFCTAGFYIMPIFYLPEWAGRFKYVFYPNPFTHLIWCWRDILYYGRFEHPWSWVVLIVLSFWVFASGYALFRRLRIMFGNYL